MIVAQPANSLANQMFAYASVKSIALDRNLEFKYINKHASFWENINASNDKKYGRDFDTIFSISNDECLSDLPPNLNVINQGLCENTGKVWHTYQRRMLEIPDNSLVEGILASPQYFVHRLEEVRNWFCFRPDIEACAEQKINDLRKKYPGKKIISIHFRVGKNYRDGGYLLKYSYWKVAAEYIMKYYQGNLIFLVFYDRWMRYPAKITSLFPCEIYHGSSAEDLCLMTKCDGNILSNSTFSIWGALLNTTSEITVRPSVYPIHSNMIQEDSFLDSWEIVKAERNLISAFLGGIIHYDGMKRRIANFFYKLMTRCNNI